MKVSYLCTPEEVLNKLITLTDNYEKVFFKTRKLFKILEKPRNQ